MAKKLISVWLSLTILVFSSISVFAATAVKGDFFLKDIVINGETIYNYQLNNPVVFYQNLVYIPIDQDMGKILGYTATADWESRTLKITEGKHYLSNVSERWSKNNLDNLVMTAYTGMNVTVTDSTSEQTETLDLKGYPLLGANNTLYVPLSSIVTSKILGIKSFYESYSGIYITTTGADPKNTVDMDASAFNKGATAYIMSQNSSYGISGTLEMVLYFKQYGMIYGVDPTLLMGIARAESTFTTSVVNSQNCCGLMQIMASTGRGYGFSKPQLLTAKGNIQMGAMYISNQLNNFGGNVTKALSAYNMGAARVKSGSIATSYVNKVTSHQKSLNGYLTLYGYSG